MVEFAIVLPLLLLLIFGMIEFGFILYNKAMITNASREGGRQGILFDDQRSAANLVNDVKAAVNNYCSNLMIPKAENPVTTVSGACSTVGAGANGRFDRAGLELVVTVDYTYPFIVFPNIAALFGGTFGASLDMSGVTSMRCE
jgi:Flp pilus assembly protein TadG